MADYCLASVDMMNWLSWYCILSHCFFAFVLYKLAEDLNDSLGWQNNGKAGQICPQNTPQSDRNNLTENIVWKGSSVWCYGQKRSERICKFSNLCYSPSLEEYLFFHGRSSIMEGVPDSRCSPSLLDLSSVEDHNLQYFNFLDVPITALKRFPNIQVIHQPSLIFHRFNPDNFMHVIHDDLLPMFYTLRRYFPDFGAGAKTFNLDVQLVFMEGRDEGSYFDLYEIFSERKPMLRMQSMENNSLWCFQEALVGISKATTWYDYGFKVPQGVKENHTANGQIIHQFASYVTSKLGIMLETESGKSDYVIMFSREFNRLILNELELSFAIATTFNLKVIRLSLETNTLNEIISSIQSSAGIIGMHGSILSLAIFLRPGSFLVELFPYGVNPDNYTPYKTLAEISGMDISYNTWQNKMKQNTVMHPNRTKEEGGILHLSLKEQNNILTAEEVPKHLCCDNPYWLFRIYQDTVVDVESFTQVMQSAIDGGKTLSKSNVVNVKPYPGKIKSVFCNGMIGPAIFISWKSPWNVQFFNPHDVEYEVWIQNQSDKAYMAYALNNVTQHTFAENVQHRTTYNVWVRGMISGNSGPFSDVCTCTTH